MERTSLVMRWGLAGIAGAIVAYCVLVMVVVATAPDLRMRFLLVDPHDSGAGIVIEQTINLVTAPGMPIPVSRDIVLELDGQPITTSLDFMRDQFAIRNRDFDRGLGISNSGGQDLSDEVSVKFRREALRGI